MTTESQREPIYERVRADCDPFTFPEPWDLLPPNSDVLKCPADPAPLWKEMRRRFEKSDLLARGVAVRTDDGDLCLAPALQDPSSPMIVLKHRKTGATDLLTDGGCLDSSRLPLWAGLEDASALRAQREFHVSGAGHERFGVFLACSATDAAILRCLGLPATTARGLENLAGRDSARFRRRFGQEAAIRFERRKRRRLRSPNRGADDALSPWDCRLYLVAWSLGMLDRALPALAAAVSRRMEILADWTPLRYRDFAAWTLGDHATGYLAHCLERGRPEELGELFLGNAAVSFTEATVELEPPLQRPAPLIVRKRTLSEA